MTKLLKRYGVWALALSMAMVGCDGVQGGALMGPGSSSDVLIVTTDDNGYTTATETEPEVGVVTAVIGPNGGELNIGDHRLTVPAGAVDAPTTFVMNKLPGEIKVDLTATRVLPNDVGAAGFLKPVRLGLSYSNAANVTSTSKLAVAWEQFDGEVVVQESYVDPSSKMVATNLNHFSAYVIAIDE